MPLPGNADVPVGINNRPTRGWYSRGYLPHRDSPSLIQSITYRLEDSLPQEKLKELERDLEDTAEESRDAERRKRIEAWLDAGIGCCALKHPDVARYVEESLKHFHGARYILHAWCIMPNHVHVMVEPLSALSKIIQGWKSFTSRWILKQNRKLVLGIPNPERLWMREYWDRFIRDQKHFQSVVDYIHQNPVKAGLCSAANEWRWSSAHLENRGSETDGDVGAPGN